jgi:hypothetical protein
MPFVPLSRTAEEYPLKKAESLAIYRKNEILDIRKLSSKWIPKCLNANQKLHPILASWTDLGEMLLIFQPPRNYESNFRPHI